MEQVVEFEAVTKRYGDVCALSGMTLSVTRGACLGLVGRNGAGKTTTIRLATGLLAPSAGRVRMFGLDPKRDATTVRRRLGVMAQDDDLLDALTPGQYLQLVGRLHRLATDEIDRRSAELFELLELGAPTGALISELSYGTRKKVALSAALLPGRELVLLDEPFEGIDPITSRTVRGLIAELSRRGTTVLLSSHLLGEVERLCSTVAILDRGRLVTSGTVADLRAAAPGTSDLEELLVALVGTERSAGLSWL